MDRWVCLNETAMFVCWKIVIWCAKKNNCLLPLQPRNSPSLNAFSYGNKILKLISQYYGQEYNAMSDDLRDDEETRCELHQQVDDLRERLWNICDERKEQAEKERSGNFMITGKKWHRRTPMILHCIHTDRSDSYPAFDFDELPHMNEQ